MQQSFNTFVVVDSSAVVQWITLKPCVIPVVNTGIPGTHMLQCKTMCFMLQ